MVEIRPFSPSFIIAMYTILRMFGSKLYKSKEIHPAEIGVIHKKVIWLKTFPAFVDIQALFLYIQIVRRESHFYRSL